MAEEMQLHQQLIHHAPMNGADHMGEGGMKGALAVGNGGGGAHAISSNEE
jgi:hypothetical protein